MEVGNNTEFQNGTEIISFTTYILFCRLVHVSPSNDQAHIKF